MRMITFMMVWGVAQGNRLNGCELGSRSLRKYDS